MIEQAEDVNAQIRAARAHERNRLNGRLQDSRQITKTKPEPWYSKYLKRFEPEELIVAGREVKGFVIPSWAAAVFLGGLLAVGGYAYRSITIEQQFTHDALIKLQTQREDEIKSAMAAQEAARQDAELQRLWREKIDKQMARLEMSNPKLRERN